MSQFPQMLFKLGSEIQIDGRNFDTKIVNDEAEFEAAVLEGWFVTTTAVIKAEAAAKEIAARAAAEAQAAEAAKPADQSNDSKGPTRAELEARATAANVPFSPRLSDKKLEAAVLEAEAAKPAE